MKKLISILSLSIIMVVSFCSCNSSTKLTEIDFDQEFVNVLSVNNYGYEISAMDLGEKFGTKLEVDLEKDIDGFGHMVRYKPVKASVLGRECDVTITYADDVLSIVYIEVPAEDGLYEEIKAKIVANNGEQKVNGLGSDWTSIWYKGKTALGINREDEKIIKIQFNNNA